MKNLNEVAKNMGYGKVFVRENGEICLTNKSNKVVLTLNSDFTVKFARHNMDEEVKAIKIAMETRPETSNSNVVSANRVDSGCGFKMENTKTNWYLVNKYGFDAIEKTN